MTGTDDASQQGLDHPIPSPATLESSSAATNVQQRKRKADSVLGSSPKDLATPPRSPPTNGTNGVTVTKAADPPKSSLRPTISPASTSSDAPNKRMKPSELSDADRIRTLETDLKNMRAELLATKNACLKAKLDNEQSKSKVNEKEKALNDLKEEYQRFKTQAMSTIDKYEKELQKRSSQDSESHLKQQLDQSKIRIQELEQKIKADRVQWERERQQMAEMIELLDQIEQATKTAEDPEWRTRARDVVAETSESRRQPAGSSAEGLSNADLGIQFEEEEEEEDPNLNAIIPVDEETLKRVEEQKKLEEMMKVEVPEEALAELKKEPSIVEDFPLVVTTERKPLIEPLQSRHRRELAMAMERKRMMPPPFGPPQPAGPMKMGQPPNPFGRPLVKPPGMMGPGLPPNPMAGSKIGPMPPPPFGQPGFPPHPMDPVAAYFAMVAAFPQMGGGPMIPPGMPPPSMEMMRQMMESRSANPSDPVGLPVKIKTEADSRPATPNYGDMPGGKMPILDDKETTIYKVKAALYVEEPQKRVERKECDQGTVAVKAVLSKPGSGRLVMYDDWNDFKVLNVVLSANVSTKVAFRDVRVTVEVEHVTLTYVINLSTPQAAQELFAAIQNVSQARPIKEDRLSNEVVDFLKSALPFSSPLASGSGSTAATAAEAESMRNRYLDETHRHQASRTGSAADNTSRFSPPTQWEQGHRESDRSEWMRPRDATTRASPSISSRVSPHGTDAPSRYRDVDDRRKF
ncbi:hypothetical protein HK104_005339 [Borealophlyctis nickersoniae]|nr:hypothetical protein HK104_005339 [Borealophlyctis nickersoniae]